MLKKYKKSYTVFDYPRSGQTRVLSPRAHELIDNWLQDNNEITTNELLIKLREEENMLTSRSSVARA